MSTLTPPASPGTLGVGDWDFGDYPYGLEPLAMPPAGRAPAGAEHRQVAPPPCDPERICGELRVLDGSGPGPGRLGAPPALSYDQLFWFRWITGHQVTFALWRLMGRILEDAAAGRDAVPGPAAMARLECYAHGYCAMLLYSGSCPRGLYARLIRPAMFLQHRGFSGTWAPDYVQVRDLLRGRLPWLGDGRAAGLRAAIDAQRMVHDSVAARLVPGGHSLLQQSIAETPVRPSERTAVLYDNFFMTLRGPVSDETVALGLMRRLRAVGLDLAVNGLYPLGCDGGEEAAAWKGSVAESERRVGTVLAAAAVHAADPARQALPAV